METTLVFHFTGANDPFAMMAVRRLMRELAVNDVLSGAVHTALEHMVEDEGVMVLERVEVISIEVVK